MLSKERTYHAKVRAHFISAHMAANLADNVRSTFEGYVVRSVFCVWMDRQYNSLALDPGGRELQTIYVQ